jgi:HK97 family phage prohead protease
MGTLIKGYASIFGNVDSEGTIFAPGAYSGFLAANPGIRVPLLWHHNLMDPTALHVGMTTDIREDETGLFFEGELADTRLGRDVSALLDLSDQGTSLEFFDGSGMMDTETGIITLDTASFREFTLVTPGNQANLLATAGHAETFQSEAAEVAAAILAIRETFKAAA